MEINMEDNQLASLKVFNNAFKLHMKSQKELEKEEEARELEEELKVVG